MTYNLLVTEPLSTSAVAEALAECFRVRVRDVDVGDEDTDIDARNWDALVICEAKSVPGDVRTSLDIYIRDDFQPRPSEPDLAAALARVLGHSVLYPAEETQPSSCWVAAADGTVARARLLDPDEDPDDDEAGFKVDAVEAPIADLPRAQVIRIPEVVYEQRKPTPLSDRLATSLDALGTGRTDESGSPYWMAVTRSGAWEQLVRTMADGWAPAGWYPVELYVQNVDARDELEVLRRELSQEAAELLVAAVEPVDRLFVELTVSDPTWYLELASQPLLDVPGEDGGGWWWRRRPDPLPW